MFTPPLAGQRTQTCRQAGKIGLTLSELSGLSVHFTYQQAAQLKTINFKKKTMANYPLPKFHFIVDWGGSRMGFTEITGLDFETKVIEYRDGSSPEYHMIKMPGMQKFSNIIMKRGLFKGDNDFYNWWNTAALNTIERRDITISLLNEKHAPVVVWRVRNAWPVKVLSTDLKADSNEVAIETIELAHEGLWIQND